MQKLKINVKVVIEVLKNYLLPPIRAAEIVECVRKYMDGISKSAKLKFLLTRSSNGVFVLMDYG